MYTYICIYIYVHIYVYVVVLEPDAARGDRERPAVRRAIELVDAYILLCYIVSYYDMLYTTLCNTISYKYNVLCYIIVYYILCYILHYFVLYYCGRRSSSRSRARRARWPLYIIYYTIIL